MSTASKPSDRLSDSEFLARRAEDARQALRKAISNAAMDTAHGVDPSVWMRRYPIATLGAAVVGGFAIAASTVPGKHEPEKPVKRNPIARAIAAAAKFTKDMKAEVSKGVDPPAEAAPHAHAEGGAAESWGKMVFREIMDLARPALMSFLTAQLSGAMKHDGNTHDGHAAASEPPAGDGTGASVH